MLLQGSSCMKEAQTETFQGLSIESNCSSVPTDPCYPTAEPDEALPTHNESWEKEKTSLPLKAFQEKVFDLSLCLWGRKGGSPRPSMTYWPCAMQPCEKGPGPTAAPCSHPRRTPACSGTCLRITSIQSSGHGFLSQVSMSQLGSNVHHVHQSREVELRGSLSLLGGSEELLQVFESVRQHRALLQFRNLASLLTPSLLSS